ncbi:uroporphyrinogen-III C-methyltransferase [Limosilactobacillus reuteri]|uniref:uroporphyrinogen-III C-methyltransferase n=1 Tax=Limosilactobacillus reuteri TaxID=1598 RepID=UPI000A1ECD3A|nr:uroporphyrinogen-III C-methyltransferase [Limosilactobacillus reuteri]
MNGRVTLLGAGPGDPELLTLIGKRRLSEADIVLYDRLIDPSLLAFTNDNSELIDVGKMPLHHKVKQSKINEMLVEYARQGKKVVRLKAGDPYVFGRGGEEAQVLQQANVDFEVIPGITSAIAGLAAAGIPITHRDFASSFHVITGHHKKDGQQLDWENIAHQEGTLVFLMGMAQLPNICRQLVINGKAAKTPVAIIQWATQWRQKMVIGDLENINSLVEQNHLSSPALIVVGEVVKLSPQLNISRPLDGIHLLVPFSKKQRLFSNLEDLGATADFYQRSLIKPLEQVLPNLDKYDAIIVDDMNAYHQFINLLLQDGNDLRRLVNKEIVAGNKQVARQLKKVGILASLELPIDSPSQKILEIGASEPIKGYGDFLQLYKKESRNLSLPFDLREFNGVIFPSTMSVKDFLDSLNEEQRSQLSGLKAFVMGEKVYQAAKQGDFSQIIRCPTNIKETIVRIKEEFIHG